MPANQTLQTFENPLLNHGQQDNQTIA